MLIVEPTSGTTGGGDGLGGVLVLGGVEDDGGVVARVTAAPAALMTIKFQFP